MCLHKCCNMFSIHSAKLNDNIHCVLLCVSDMSERVGNTCNVLCSGTYLPTVNSTVDTDRQVQPSTAPEACWTMQPVLLRGSNTLKGIKTEPVTDINFTKYQSVAVTDSIDDMKSGLGNGSDVWNCGNNDLEAGYAKKRESKSHTDSSDLKIDKCEPTTDMGSLVVVKIEPVTDPDTKTNIKCGPVTDADTATTIQPVDDPAVIKTDTADVSMEPLPPREGHERLPSEPQPADKEVS